MYLCMDSHFRKARTVSTVLVPIPWSESTEMILLMAYVVEVMSDLTIILVICSPLQNPIIIIGALDIMLTVCIIGPYRTSLEMRKSKLRSQSSTALATSEFTYVTWDCTEGRRRWSLTDWTTSYPVEWDPESLCPQHNHRRNSTESFPRKSWGMWMIIENLMWCPPAWLQELLSIWSYFNVLPRILIQ